MHPLYTEFSAGLDLLDREQCVSYVLAKLQGHEIDVATLYNEILTPAQYEDLSKKAGAEDHIWLEHARSSIIRTIIECCYPYVIRERDHKYISLLKEKAVVLCPQDELHELGPRMVADYFTLCGYRTFFFGANTPQDDILNGIKFIKPRFVAISITNYYNLMAARNAIGKILDIKGQLDFKVIMGGQACRGNPEVAHQMGADLVLDSFADIQSLEKR